VLTFRAQALVELALSGRPAHPVLDADGRRLVVADASGTSIAFDINGDGTDEFASISAVTNTVTIYSVTPSTVPGATVLNVRDFSTRTTCISPNNIAAADFNGDGLADLVVTCDQDVYIHLSDGFGDFKIIPL
jgi:FG-GAP-like repeat